MGEGSLALAEVAFGRWQPIKTETSNGQEWRSPVEPTQRLRQFLSHPEFGILPRVSSKVDVSKPLPTGKYDRLVAGIKKEAAADFSLVQTAESLITLMRLKQLMGHTVDALKKPEIQLGILISVVGLASSIALVPEDVRHVTPRLANVLSMALMTAGMGEGQSLKGKVAKGVMGAALGAGMPLAVDQLGTNSEGLVNVLNAAGPFDEFGLQAAAAGTASAAGAVKEKVRFRGSKSKS